MAKIPPRRKVTEKPPTAHHLWKVKPEMEKDFIDFCNESAALHGHKGHSLKEWTSVITKVNAKYDQHFDQKTLKNKWDSLRHGYMVWRKLITKTGHGRNADGSFNWPPEVWKAAIEQDSRVAKFQYEPLKYHQELEMLFEGTFAAGESRENCGEDVVSDSFVDVDADADADPDVDADPCVLSITCLWFRDLSFNAIEGDIPFSISKLKQLESLVLKNNLLTGPIPSTLSQIPNLKTLDLAQNMLSGDIHTHLLE